MSVANTQNSYYAAPSLPNAGYGYGYGYPQPWNVPLPAPQSATPTYVPGTAGSAGVDSFIEADDIRNRPTRVSAALPMVPQTGETKLVCPNTSLSDLYPDSPPDIHHIVNVIGMGPNNIPGLAGMFMAGEPFDLHVVQPAKSTTKLNQSIIEMMVDIQATREPMTSPLPFTCRCGAHELPDPSSQPAKLNELTIHHIESRSMKLCSTILQEGIRLVFNQYYPKLAWSKDGLVLPEPYTALLRYYPEISAIAQNLPTIEHEENFDLQGISTISTIPDRLVTSGIAESKAEVIRQFAMLEDLLRLDYETFAQRHYIQLQSTNPSVSFDGLWLIYRPGANVYFENSGGKTCAVVQEFKYGKSRQDATVTIWQLVADGEMVDRHESTFEIFKYQGDRPLVDLDLKLLRFMDVKDRELLQKQLQDRGRLTYRVLKKGSCEMHYDGPMTSVQTRVLDDEIIGEQSYSWTSHFKGRVIIDQKKGLESGLALGTKRHTGQDELPWYGTGRERPSFIYETYEDIDIETTDELTDHQYMLLQPLLSGFLLKIKTWRLLSADFLTEVERVKNSTKNLVLDEAHLKMIRAMSEKLSGDSIHWGADFIPGKGLGRTILLHGPPGVGKTYTVECIAEEFERPLLPLSPSDIGAPGTDNVEEQLNKWFTLAERWNAVLLIDEADLFLERRKQADVQRNGMVTVFLRQLEYFQGLLFVTTNRVGHIDDAFISRVQIIIEYPKIESKARERIWNAFFDKLEEEKDGHIAISHQAKSYVLHSDEVFGCNWNGRDIRNAIQTAIRLAAYDVKDAPQISGKSRIIQVKEVHFRQIAQMSRSFQTHLFNIQDADEDARAAYRKDRPRPPRI